ncbi:MAG: hypothetical protein LUE31_05310 [Lachnospiraceae bacterium]|nr:hypothetical protein [Lachnospiraceae bacterium]
MKMKKAEKQTPKSSSRRRILGVAIDLRLLLAVALIVLAAIGIFAWMFRQIHVGYVEEDGYVVSSSQLYGYLNKGAEEGSAIQLSSVKSNDEIFSRAGNYYVGQDMAEYQSVYPLFANDGQALYFMNDSSMLVTEDFELLSTYQGMFVTGGTSFNADRTQADIETIYLVKLKNGLYQNALTISLTGSGYSNSISVNSTILFGDDYLRWYSVFGDTLVYHEISDPSGLTITIDGVEFPYSEFLEELNGASEYEVTQPQSSSDDDDDAQEEEEQESGTVEAEDAGKAEASGTSGSDDDKADNDKVKKDTDGSTGSASGTTAGSSGSGSASGSGSGSNSSDTASGDSSGDDGSSSGSSTSGSSGGSGTASASYIKPTVKVSNVKIGVYTLDFDIEIVDEGGNLKKVTATAYWNNMSNSQRKSAKTSGSYTISNLQSGQTITFVVTMKYRTADGSYTVEEVYKTVDLSTYKIEEGTNTLSLSYLQDTYYDVTSSNDGYDQIYPNQIQIKNIYLEEQDDAIVPTSTSTLDSICYFRIYVYELDDDTGKIVDEDNPIVYTLSNSERSKLTQTTTTEETDEEGNVISTTTSEGLTWTSDSSTASLDECKEYVYEFEIVDRYGDALMVDYMVDVDGESRYENGDLITGTASDRHAWTCAAHPTGKLTLGTATYESQTVTVALTNKDGGAQISELYLTEADSYGRYVEWDTTTTDGVTASDITGAVGTSKLTEAAHFRLMEGKDADTGDTLPLYAGVKVTGKEGYDGSESMSWEKLQLPAFANNTYTITLTAVYNIGDRQGDYTVALATRSNARTTSLSTLGNVSFTRSAGDVGSDSVAYSYTSSTVSSKLLPLIYEYDYTLTDTTDSDNPTSALTLRVTKNYEEIEGDKEKTGSTGIALTLEDGDTIYANEWSVNYSFQYRDRTDSSKTVYTVTGSVYLDDSGYLVRTIELDGVLVATLYYSEEGLTTDKSEAEKVDDDALLSAFAVMLDMDTYADVIGNYSEYIKEMNPTLDTAALPTASSVTVEQSAMVTLDFPSQVDQVDGEGNITLDVNSVCSIGVTAEKLCDALSVLDSDTTASDDDKEFCDVWLNALSAQAAMLSVELSGLESKHTYVAEASAYAYQSGNIGVTVDDEGNVEDESGAPVITSVTTTSTTLTLSTQKSAPEVNIEIFTYSSDLVLYDFYVYDPDEAIVEHSGMRSVTVNLYEYDEETGTETLIEQITGLTDCIIDDLDDAETYAQDISFSNLTEGQVYRIKVTADAYDTTPDGSSTTYGVLIGESSAEADGEDTYFSSTGVWEVTCGSSMTTGLTLEEVFSEDPYTLENQLIDFTTMEDDLDAGGTGGWEVGTLSTSDGVSVTEDTSYIVTPYLELRYDKNDDGVADDLTADDVFIARGINGGTVYFYNKNKGRL